MKLLLCTPTKAGGITLSVTEEGESEPRTLTVTGAEYASLGAPAAGGELDEATKERLILLDECHRARRAAARLLEFGDNNKRTLIRKLRTRGFSAAAAEDATAYMEKKGYLREEDLLLRCVRASFKKLWGPRKITAALTARGFARAEVEACIARLLDGEIDIRLQKRLLLEKHEGLDTVKKRALLYRYGYDPE